MSTAATLLAFLDFKEFPGESRRGGILVTDLKTEPIEFRCTDPVAPTALQKMLWGGRMAPYIGTTLMGKPLLQSLSNKPSLVIIRCPDFMDLRPMIAFPLVQVLRNEELGNVSSLAAQDSDGDDQLHSVEARFEPVIVKVHSGFEEDRDKAREMLTEMFKSYNILEPFARIANALDMVNQQNQTAPPRK